MSAFTRRLLLGRGFAAAAGAAVPASLLAAPAASAQATDETDALELLVDLEQAAELAFSLAAEEGDVDPEAKRLFEELSIHAGDHATAFAEAMDQLLVEPPEDSSDPDDYESLEGFDPAAAQDDLLAFLVDVELGLIEAYESEVAVLDEPDLLRSASQVAASHAQALVALRLLLGNRDVVSTELPEPAQSSTEGTGETGEDSDSG